MQQQFTGTEIIKIDIANCYGLDKEGWAERLLWAEFNNDDLEVLEEKADDKLLYRKAVLALRAGERGEPIGHNVFMDATASGCQVMAALSGCKETAKHVNMINTGRREDVYIEVATKMNALLTPLEQVNRLIIKKPFMTHWYNKSKQPSLSMNQQKAFYHVIGNNFPGAEGVKDITNHFWDSTAFNNSWTLPDGHMAKVLVTEVATTRIEVDELNHTKFSYRFESNQPSTISTSLCPNIIHSVDAYIAREMVRRAANAGFELAHIHDAFTCHPNYMGMAMQFYREILAEIADSNLLANILSEISGQSISVQKYSHDLSSEILKSEYMLS